MKNQHVRSQRRRRAIGAALLIGSGAALAAEEGRFSVDGYLREELSWNARQWADVPGYDTTGKLSMARTTLRLNTEWQAARGVSVVGKFRAAEEIRTPFLDHLQDMGAYNYGAGGARGDLMKLYNTRRIGDAVRELYLDAKLGDRVQLRLGKQQIVWGETDFFAANDLVQGFDYTWRSFLEPANEEVRKTNISAKLNVDVPELDGSVEAFVRPGWDRRQDIGTTLDIYGGRWSSQPYAGVDFRNIDPYDYSNPVGDYKKVTGGIRWSGTAADVNYSMSFLRTFWPNPIMNGASTLTLLGQPGVPSGVTTVGRPDTTGPAGNIIYPLVNVLGATASSYGAWADAVFSTEVAYIKDAPYQFLAAGTPAGTPVSQVVAPGFDGIKRKNVVALMVRMDKNLAFAQDLLGAEKPMFFSVQLFDKWVQNYKREDALLNSVGWGARTKQHSLLLTGIFSLSYDNGRIKPELVVGHDISYGGGFFVPSVTFELSKSLRWKVEYDGFWASKWRDGSKCAPPNAASCDSSGLFGYFHHRDQLYTSLTYTF